MPTFDQLLDLLRHPDPAARTQAIIALGESGDVRAVLPLAESLRNEDHYATRTHAIQALGKLGGDRAREALIAALKDRYAPVRAAAADALGTLGDPAAVESLIAALSEGRGALRASAAQALGQLADDRAVEPLIAALDDERDDVRCYAAAALGAFRDDRAVEPLIAVLRDIAVVYGRAVCEAAAESLDQIDTPEAQAAVEAWQVRWGGPDQTPDATALIADLSDPDWATRHQAAHMLGAVGDPAAVEPLIAALDDSDPDVRDAAAEALGQLSDSRAVKPLIAALETPERFDLAQHAGPVTALGDLRDPRAVAALIPLLDRSVGDLDYKAALALEQIGTKEALNAVKRWRKAQERNPRFPP